METSSLEKQITNLSKFIIQGFKTYKKVHYLIHCLPLTLAEPQVPVPDAGHAPRAAISTD